MLPLLDFHGAPPMRKYVIHMERIHEFYIMRTFEILGL